MLVKETLPQWASVYRSPLDIDALSAILSRPDTSFDLQTQLIWRSPSGVTVSEDLDLFGFNRRGLIVHSALIDSEFGHPVIPQYRFYGSRQSPNVTELADPLVVGSKAPLLRPLVMRSLGVLQYVLINQQLPDLAVSSTLRHILHNLTAHPPDIYELPTYRLYPDRLPP